MNWNIPLYTPLLSSLDVGDLLDQVLTLATELADQGIEKNVPFAAASVYGLTALAARQGLAFQKLIECGLEDQAIMIARSIYETYISLLDISDMNSDRDQKLAEPATQNERKQRLKLREQEVKRKAKLFWDHHRAINYKTILSATKRIKRLKDRLTDIRARLTACTEDKHRKRLTDLQDQLNVELEAHQRHIKNNAKKFRADFRCCSSNFTSPKGEVADYWNKESPSVAAERLGTNLALFYQYCCSFSHSSAFAVRAILAEKSGTDEMHMAAFENLRPKLVFFSTFIILQCLGLCASVIGDAGIQLSAKVVKLNTKLNELQADRKSG